MPQIETRAVVDPGARIGEGTSIWHWTHVMGGADIGKHCSIGQSCYIGNVRIGHGCRIQNHVSIYDGVTLDEDVFVGPSSVFTNVKHPRAHVSRKREYAPTRVRCGATIGANATITCGVEIGEYAMIGAGAVITRSVPPHAIVVGAPARQIAWACRCGETLPKELHCARCKDRYSETDGRLKLAGSGA
jgi:UDP-2-acetamido-3-amino-2,3-dideoxy-glucuronate N-acetyltransferase